MRTQLLGQIPIDPVRLASDLSQSTQLEFQQVYPEFSLGRPWKGCTLWSPGGELGDGIISHYDTGRPAEPTAQGMRLPYIRNLVEEYIATEHLLFVRMAVMTNNVLVPHRDFVELEDKPSDERATNRLHIVLATSEQCLFLEGGTVYRMRPGEVWFLDASVPHSAAVLDDTVRVHLMIDMAAAPEGPSLLRFAVGTEPGIPPASQVMRPPLSERDQAGIHALSGLLDLYNLPDVLSLLSKKVFLSDCGPDYFWNTALELVRANGDPELMSYVSRMHKHYVIDRDE